MDENEVRGSRVFEYQLRSSDTDFEGVVYFGAYLRMIRDILHKLTDLPVVEVYSAYKKPLRIYEDESVKIEITPSKQTKDEEVYEFKIYKQSGELASEGRIRLAPYPENLQKSEEEQALKKFRNKDRVMVYDTYYKGGVPFDALFRFFTNAITEFRVKHKLTDFWFAVVEIQLAYIRPLKSFEEVTVELRPSRAGEKAMRFDVIILDKDEQKVAQGHVTEVQLDKETWHATVPDPKVLEAIENP